MIEILADLMPVHGTPEYPRSYNGSEFIAKKLRKWLAELGVIATYIEPGSPWDRVAHPRGGMGIAKVLTPV